MKKYLALIALLLCCQSEPTIKDLPMTQANLTKVRTTAQLTGEEVGLLQLYILSDVMSNDGAIDSTITIGAAIERQRKLMPDSLQISE